MRAECERCGKRAELVDEAGVDVRNRGEEWRPRRVCRACELRPRPRRMTQLALVSGLAFDAFIALVFGGIAFLVLLAWGLR